MAPNSFGFEGSTVASCAPRGHSPKALRVTQTGVLNWNVLGIVGGLIVGARRSGALGA